MLANSRSNHSANSLISSSLGSAGNIWFRNFFEKKKYTMTVMIISTISTTLTADQCSLKLRQREDSVASSWRGRFHESYESSTPPEGSWLLIFYGEFESKLLPDLHVSLKRLLLRSVANFPTAPGIVFSDWFSMCQQLYCVLPTVLLGDQLSFSYSFCIVHKY